MALGKVKWFNESKGFGFIETNMGQDVFVHYTSITSEGYKSLPEGAEVEFDLLDSERGPQASNVVLIQKSSSTAEIYDLERK